MSNGTTLRDPIGISSRTKSSINLKQKIQPYLFVSPTLLLLLGLMVIPVGLVIKYSFYSNVIVEQSPIFVGLENYLNILKDEAFRIAMINTSIFTIASVIAHLLLGLGFASLLNSNLISNLSKSFFRMIYILPWLFTVAIIAILWRMILNPNGVINFLITSFGLSDTPIEWLSSERTALFSVIVINIWAGYPFYMTSILAGLQGIPRDLYEAATVDGASGFQQFINVTLPQLKPIIISMSILDLIWTSQQFALIWMTTGGGPITSTELLGTYTYKLAFSQYQFSLASTSAVILLLLSMTLAFFYVRNQKVRD
jgi:multiple sugar transport system permease protein